MPGDINLKLGLFVYDTLSQGVGETIGLGKPVKWSTDG